ncbi:MAG: FAD-binding protein, partial [Pseudomonadales bacterium]|nr:FAD-binding protein [Pseudomonadales bacterium]
GLLDADAESRQATFGAGTRLADTGAPLQQIGQGMFNLPDIDRQTLAGATATSTHGTGIEFHSLSGYITGMQMVTASGDVIEADLESDPDFLKAASVGIGALGIVTKIRMQNRGAYRLKKNEWVEKTEDVLKNFDERVAGHRHVEMFPLVHSDYALVLSIDESEEPIDNPGPDPEADAAFAMAMRAWMKLPPGMRSPLINGLASQIEPSSAVDVSYKILTNIRNNRFNEMEYSVPLDQGAACLREVLTTIAEQEIDVVFPLEYRYIKGDDLLLSMFEGGPRAAISIHRTWDEDYRPYFDIIEPIFRKYGGRPHWGKLHTLGYAELTKLYPGFEDFRTLRAELDPQGRLLNDHMRKVFDV